MKRYTRQYVYMLTHPDINEVGYVGTTNNPQSRLASHMSKHGTNKEKTKWIAGLPNKPKLVILEEMNFFDDVHLDREQHWIHHFLKLGHPLTNKHISSHVRHIDPSLYAVSQEELQLRALAENERLAKLVASYDEQLDSAFEDGRHIGRQEVADAINSIPGVSCNVRYQDIDLSSNGIFMTASIE